uniref:C2H2-type domain-containing protein n=1 Tax=Syphacia muris TaxID=451379 RepID=A0A158R4E2_9BILA
GYSFKCSKCFRRFKLKHHLIRHERTHDELAVFKCPRCNASFRFVKKRDLEIKSKEGSINSDGAGTSGLESSDFSRPLLSEYNFILRLCNWLPHLCIFYCVVLNLGKVCHVCNNKFASTQSLIRHIGRKHPSEQYTKQYEIVSIASTPNLPFVCSECQKRFANPSALSLHKRRHAGDCPFECNRCGRRYPLASELRKHIRRTHEGCKSNF